MEKVVYTDEIKCCYIFFTESRLGVHKTPNLDEEYIMIPGTFIPSFSKDEGWNYAGEILQSAIIHSEIQKAKGYKVYFLVGYDLDENGEFMSSVLKDSLMKLGVSRENIFRMPLTENGYVSIMDFVNIETYKIFRTIDYMFQKKCQEKTGKRLGLLKSLSLYFLQRNRKKVFTIKNDGNSTCTVVHKHLNKERKKRLWG